MSNTKTEPYLPTETEEGREALAKAVDNYISPKPFPVKRSSFPKKGKIKKDEHIEYD